MALGLLLCGKIDQTPDVSDKNFSSSHEKEHSTIWMLYKTFNIQGIWAEAEWRLIMPEPEVPKITTMFCYVVKKNLSLK